MRFAPGPAAAQSKAFAAEKAGFSISSQFNCAAPRCADRRPSPATTACSMPIAGSSVRAGALHRSLSLADFRRLAAIAEEGASRESISYSAGVPLLETNYPLSSALPMRVPARRYLARRAKRPLPNHVPRHRTLPPRTEQSALVRKRPRPLSTAAQAPGIRGDRVVGTRAN